MARVLFRLTEKIIRNHAAAGYHADGGGLYLQVSPGGSKSWVFRFALKGRTRDMGLGATRAVSLAEARARAADCRALTAKGIDPIEHAKAANGIAVQPEATPPSPPPRPIGKTFLEFAGEYIDAHAEDWRNEKHAAQWLSTLKLYAFPVIGNMLLADIDTSHVLQILEPIWRDRTETASRVRGRIERILAAASVKGLRPATNPAAWKGHLQEALPKKRKAEPFAALPYADIPAFMVKLRGRNGIGARALEFAILTAARSGEARGAPWSEINLLEKVWTVPAERMKAGRLHVVPLSDQALTLLESVRPLRDLTGGFVFPGTKQSQFLSDTALSAVVRAMAFDITVHGFRATFKSWAEDKTHHANVVIESALAHAIGGKVEQAYMRSDRLAKRAELMADWGAYCASIPVETVVRLPREGVAA